MEVRNRTKSNDLRLDAQDASEFGLDSPLFERK